MLKLAVLCLVLACVLAHDHHHKDHKHHDHKHHDHKHHDHKHHDNGNGNGNGNGPEPTERVFGGAIQPWRPFPHFEDFVIYELPKNPPLTLLPGSAFVLIADGWCKRVSLTDEIGGYCPLNQTVCDQMINTPCAPEVANVTCFEPNKPGVTPPAGQPTNVPEGEFGNGYPFGGPLCYVEALGHKFQPSAYTSLFSFGKKFQTCVFQVAPAPTVYPEPTAETVLPADPPCPFVEQ